MSVQYDWNEFIYIFQLFSTTWITLPKQNLYLLTGYHLIILVYFLIVIWFTFYIQIMGINQTFPVSMIMDISLIIVILFAHFITTIESFLKRHKEMEIINKLSKLSAQGIDFKKVKKKLIWKWYGALFLIIILKFVGACLFFNSFWIFWGPIYFFWHSMHVRLIQVGQ